MSEVPKNPLDFKVPPEKWADEYRYMSIGEKVEIPPNIIPEINWWAVNDGTIHHQVRNGHVRYMTEDDILRKEVKFSVINEVDIARRSAAVNMVLNRIHTPEVSRQDPTPQREQTPKISVEEAEVIVAGTGPDEFRVNSGLFHMIYPDHRKYRAIESYTHNYDIIRNGVCKIRTAVNQGKSVVTLTPEEISNPGGRAALNRMCFLLGLPGIVIRPPGKRTGGVAEFDIEEFSEKSISTENFRFSSGDNSEVSYKYLEVFRSITGGGKFSIADLPRDYQIVTYEDRRQYLIENPPKEELPVDNSVKVKKPDPVVERILQNRVPKNGMDSGVKVDEPKPKVQTPVPTSTPEPAPVHKQERVHHESFGPVMKYRDAARYLNEKGILTEKVKKVLLEEMSESIMNDFDAFIS